MTVKLDATDLRYISTDAFRVLAAVEQGSKNHELVPTTLIAQISGARSGGVNKALGELAKRKLVGKVQNAKYEGYRLTYGGYDFLACRTFAKRDTVYSVGNQIGTGKESDIYVVADEEGTQSVMKIHRLGRISFRAIKSKRDYLRKGQSASWMYMSRLAAIKEFAFMKVLHEHGFPVPRPIDQSRHCLIMELIDAFPLRQIASVPSPGSLYSEIMDLIVRLAASGLIHGDFNEFNILIRDHRSEAEKDRDEENPEERFERIKEAGGDFPVVVDKREGEGEGEGEGRREKNGGLEVVLIDFPQMVSTDHVDAEYYFNRDVTCIRTFFARRFKYESSIYPRFNSLMRDGVREFDLDVEVAASGFSKGDRKALDEYLAETAAERGEEGSDDDENSEEHSDVDHFEEEEEVEEVEEEESTTIPNSSEEPITLENLHLHSSALGKDPSSSSSSSSHDDHTTTRDDENSSEEDDDRSTTADSLTSSTASHRRHRPSHRTPAPSASEVGTIVSDRLARSKKSTERKHHGKKLASGNVLGKQKGSKMRMDARRNIKESQSF